MQRSLIRHSSLLFHLLLCAPLWLLALGPTDWFFVGQISGQIYAAVTISFFSGFYGFSALDRSHISMYLLNFANALWSWSCLLIQHLLFVFPDVIWLGLLIALSALFLQEHLSHPSWHKYHRISSFSMLALGIAGIVTRLHLV